MSGSRAAPWPFCHAASGATQPRRSRQSAARLAKRDEPAACPVGEAAPPVEHQLADRVPGRRREAEADARHRGDRDVVRLVQALDHRPPVRRVLDQPGPASDHARMGGRRKQLGEPRGEAAHQRRRRPRQRAVQRRARAIRAGRRRRRGCRAASAARRARCRPRRRSPSAAAARSRSSPPAPAPPAGRWPSIAGSASVCGPAAITSASQPNAPGGGLDRHDAAARGPRCRSRRCAAGCAPPRSCSAQA